MHRAPLFFSLDQIRTIRDLLADDTGPGVRIIPANPLDTSMPITWDVLELLLGSDDRDAALRPFRE